MRDLYQLLGIEMSSSMAYHPQSNQQTKVTKHVNPALEKYIELFMSEQQDDWDEFLLLGEFQYNNHIHTPTQYTLFLLDIRWMPWIGFEPNTTASHMESITEFSTSLSPHLVHVECSESKHIPSKVLVNS